MQRCSPSTLLQATTKRPTLTYASKCTNSTASIWPQCGPTSSHSTSPSSLSPSPSPQTSICTTSTAKPSYNPIIPCITHPHPQRRHASSKSWKSRQTVDPYTHAARLQDLKSRAAFKLLQLNDKHRLFRPGQTVVDLGFAPGSWSQVAIDLVKPSGRVIGVDLLPVRPPKGVSAIQGDFLSQEVQRDVRRFVGDEGMGRAKGLGGQGYLDAESSDGGVEEEAESENMDVDVDVGRCVDVVLSDMCEPWDLVEGHYKRTLSNPYYRMMNTSGNAFRDHAGSMVSKISSSMIHVDFRCLPVYALPLLMFIVQDLCRAALSFAHDTLKTGGHFICKFYQGGEDKALERSLKALFTKVHREKPESSRSASKEAYFVGLKRLAKSDRGLVLGEG